MRARVSRERGRTRFCAVTVAVACYLVGGVHGSTQAFEKGPGEGSGEGFAEVEPARLVVIRSTQAMPDDPANDGGDDGTGALPGDIGEPGHDDHGHDDVTDGGSDPENVNDDDFVLGRDSDGSAAGAALAGGAVAVGAVALFA